MEGCAVVRKSTAHVYHSSVLNQYGLQEHQVLYE